MTPKDPNDLAAMNDEARCAWLAKKIAEATASAADLPGDVLANALASAAIAQLAVQGRPAAQIRAWLHELGDGLLLAEMAPSGADRPN